MQILADNEFEYAKSALLSSHLNIVPRHAHVPEVERSIRTTKQIVRHTFNILPYKHIYKLMVTGIIIHSTTQLNIIPAENGISEEISPTTIVTRLQVSDYNVIKCITFGIYAQVNKDHDLRKNNQSRMTGAIDLYATCSQ